MTVIVRRVNASPVRTATQAWAVIGELIFAGRTDAAELMNAASGVASSSIAEGIAESSPFVLTGAGPRMRVYCVYGEDAVEGEEANESPLDPDWEGADWKFYVPCLSEDVGWATEVLRAVPRIIAYDVAEGIEDPTEESKASPDMRINVDLFRKL